MKPEVRGGGGWWWERICVETFSVSRTYFMNTVDIVSVEFKHIYILRITP